jgi:very-short-patch-repair endonuclease
MRARAMRLSPTDAERKLWLRLVIELDGGQHAVQGRRDATRSQFLESEGYRVLRFWNNEVLTNIDGVLEVIQSAILATPTPTPPHKGEGKKYVHSRDA